MARCECHLRAPSEMHSHVGSRRNQTCPRQRQAYWLLFLLRSVRSQERTPQRRNKIRRKGTVGTGHERRRDPIPATVINFGRSTTAMRSVQNQLGASRRHALAGSQESVRVTHMARFGQPHPKKRGFFPNNRAGTRASRKVERERPTKAKPTKQRRPANEPSKLGNMKVIEVAQGDAAVAMLGAIAGDAAIAT